MTLVKSCSWTGNQRSIHFMWFWSVRYFLAPPCAHVVSLQGFPEAAMPASWALLVEAFHYCPPLSTRSHAHSSEQNQLLSQALPLAFLMLSVPGKYRSKLILLCFPPQILYAVKGSHGLKAHSVKVFLILYKPCIVVCMKNACVNLAWIKG